MHLNVFIITGWIHVILRQKGMGFGFIMCDRGHVRVMWISLGKQFFHSAVDRDNIELSCYGCSGSVVPVWHWWMDSHMGGCASAALAKPHLSADLTKQIQSLLFISYWTLYHMTWMTENYKDVPWGKLQSWNSDVWAAQLSRRCWSHNAL